MSLVLGGFDVVGDEDEGGLVLGAKARRGRKVVARKVKVPTPRWMSATTSQGVSRPHEEMDFLPFATFDITAATPTGFLLARPQRPFRGERLIMSAVQAGDNQDFNVVIDPAIYVGAVQVGGAQGATPATAFGANAFGVRLSFPAAGQGTDIKIFVRALATPGAEDAPISVSATLIGRAMR